MKTTRVGIAVLLVAGLAVVVLVRSRRQAPPAITPEEAPSPVVAPPPSQSVAVHQSPKPFNMLRSEDYTEQDWAQLGRMFTNEFKPALQKWCSAYRGHISIRPEDLKLENFRGQLGVRTSPLQTISYSFVVGDTTITFGERDGNAFVFQMMTGQAAKDTSSPPPPGTVPNLNVPVTRDEVMAMEVADTGNQFPPNQVYIWPTGSGSAIQGGARVDFGGHDNPIYYNFSGSNVSYIFGPGGSIINYERDGPPPSGYMTNHPPLSTW